MIAKESNMRPDIWDHVHGGNGKIDVLHVFEADQTAGRCTLCAKSIFHPGDSIGVHVHSTNAEIYYVLEGELTVVEDGTEYTLRPGDAAFTANGASHSVENRTQQNAVMLAVIMK